MGTLVTVLGIIAVAAIFAFIVYKITKKDDGSSSGTGAGGGGGSHPPTSQK